VNLAEKKAQGEIIAKSLDGAGAAIVAEYRGLTVEQLTQLRVELNKCESKFSIGKNRVVKKAIESSEDLNQISEWLTGPNGICYLNGDAAAATKVVMDFAKNNDKFIIKGGIFDRKAVSTADLNAISELPSKEVLLGQIVGSLVAPHRGLLGVLKAVPRDLVGVINAIKDKKSE
jgi:large subunit ribosomal protein L10